MFPKEIPTLVGTVIIIAVAVVFFGAIFIYQHASTLNENNPQQKLTACTQEAKVCPDGSTVGRTGLNCEFAECPQSTGACVKDSDCPSPQYICQELQGMGTACPSNDPSCVPTHTIVQGVCKLKEGGKCSSDSDCISGLLCHSHACTNPRDGSCSSPNDRSCPTGYQCVQSCGPPLARQKEPPPPYFCELNEVASKPRMCPICLASNTKIATPSGDVNVKNIRVGM